MAEEKKPEVQKAPKSSPRSDEDNIFGVLAYLHILCLVPLLTKRNNDFVYFHAKQGLVLLIVWIIAPFTMFLAPFVYLFCVVMLVIGIINVVSGKKEPLPLLGKIAEKFKF